jgi:arabinofuranan 3-O-arabinosyltransferase
VTLDGAPLAVAIGTGTQGLLTGRRFPLTACDGTPIPIGPGWHELRIADVFQPQFVSLRSGFPSSVQPAPIPRLDVRPTASGYRISVTGSTAPFYLVLGQNVSTAWRASINGRSLGPSLVLDGFSAGWRVDRTGDFSIRVTYGAQERQNIALAASGVGLPIVVGIALVGARRRRRRT